MSRRLLPALVLPALVLPAIPAALHPSPATASDAGSDRATVTTTSEPFFDEQVLYRRGEEGYSCFRIPAIVRTTDGTLLAFAEGRVTDCGDDGDIDLVVKRSTDGGATWSPLRVVLEGHGETRGNPMPVVDERTGRVVLFTTRNGPDPCANGCDRDPFVQISEDNGLTWSPARELPELKLPEWNHWYATGPVHGIQLKRGPHAGRLVISANHESYDAATGEHVYGVHLAYSDDGGETWRLGAIVDHSDGSVRPNETTLVELTDGRIYVNVREHGTDPGHRGYVTSSDGGETFDGPVRTVPELQAPTVQGALLRLRATDEGDAYDRILFSSPAHPASREAMTVRSSYDEARTWETWQEGKVINWGFSAYSDMVKLGEDTIGLLYEHGANDPYQEIRFARFNEAFLATPNGVPPNVPEPPAPGPRTPDLSPYGNDGYVRGGAQRGEGVFGSALVLDRIDDRVEIPYSPSLDLGDGDFTWSAWIRYTATSGSHAILWAYRVGISATPAVWLRAEPSQNRIRAFISTEEGNRSVASVGAYNDGEWHHVVLQRTKGRFVLRVDGAEVAATEAPPGSVTAGKDFGIWGVHVGQRLDGFDRFRGAIDEVRIYRRALSEAELERVRTRNTPIKGKLSLWLPFERVETPPPEPGATTPDLSSYGNHGYVRGGATLTEGRFGTGIGLDGEDDRVEVPYSDSLALGEDDFTWTVWIRYDATSGGHAILWAHQQGSGPTPQVWLRAEPASDRIRALIATAEGTATVASPSAYNDGEWHHVVLQRADERFVLWVDGTRVAETTAPSGSVTAADVDGLHVGQRLDGADRFRGTIDEVRIYRRALSPAELERIRHSNDAIGDGLVLWHPYSAIDPE
ncbi:sialidase family protein [Thermasporomyces composti]|uniref:exo-alpha-sialidase n=1 Tax=Thermasporomyces composti TaxID=696763 RepID=A0A3D9V8F6_THECX|nr:sialidase family protein [Thermasporomyces composti]REF38078.1 sialidase-1 [Thermasporomyces composti]